MSPIDASRAYAWSLPNLLTYARIAAVPVVVGCLLGDDFALRWVALVLYVAAAITDYVDGYLARAWSQQSPLGRMLDPIADKLLVASCLLAFAATGMLNTSENDFGTISFWAAVVILCREILVSGLREFLAELRVSVPVTRLAKWKTAAQLLAVGFLVAGPAGDALIPYITEAGHVLLWLSAGLTLYTGYDYFRAGLRQVFTDAPEVRT
ncbi:CDP-diacylglycerol--glycerol-3-phosphate 3-phosphatidyltransferase [Terrihabitans sp. B22-R8]|uniref:CDP-diacylglycerol--glycerol-3-phosphate 3-phosphatidyltransferase n=1 Tax=Terrihabitans sp. B22-R8 TaxID=3425128 RepID=UPI00403CD0C4